MIGGWLGAALLCALVGLFVFYLFASNQFNAGGIVLGVSVVIVIVAVVGARSWYSVRAVERRNAGALVARIVMYDQFRAQLNSLAEASQMAQPRLGFHTAATLSVNSDHVRLFLGANSEPFFSIPTSQLTSIDIVKAPQGKWILPSLEMTFEANGTSVGLDFCVMNSGFSFPHVVGRKKLERTLTQAQLATV